MSILGFLPVFSAATDAKEFPNSLMKFSETLRAAK